MAPRDPSHLRHGSDELDLDLVADPGENIEETKLKEQIANFKTEIVWRNIILMSLVHAGGFYGLYLCFTAAKWQTIAFGKS